jgi:primosomal protein N' (replication factor Y)
MSEQQRLFADEPAEWELDDAEERLVATVLFPRGPAAEFDYIVPDRWRGAVRPGQRVRVPFGKSDRTVVAYCLRVASKAVGRKPLKSIEGLVDREPLLSPAMVRLTQWMALHYLAPLGQVFETVVPAGVRQQAGTRKTVLLSLAPNAKELLRELKLKEKQLQIAKKLFGDHPPMTAQQWARLCGCTPAPIQTLRKHGLLVTAEARIRTREHDEAPVAQRANLVLNADQQSAFDAILRQLNAREHRTVLLHGITGSGKTEVYIRAIQEVVRFGRQAIVLVPEISLTPQTKQRFRERFAEVAVLHSHLTDSERHWHWQRIAEGRVPVVVGARSAVFAPTPHLGLIVMDEEHEGSFKQDSTPRYHARDVALERARDEGVPLVLGSATPSLESFLRAQRGEYDLVELPRRVEGRPLPDVVTVDLRVDFVDKLSRGALSRQLAIAMNQALEQGGQVILLLNRRGFSTHIQCPACGLVLQCPHCEIALTHHVAEQIALCHYCDYQIPAPAKCPDCTFPGIRYNGFGTQKLEHEVRARFPKYRCLRMDTDSMQSHGSHEKALDQFRAGEVRILLGTQMIAKGLDFPNVSLVGVVNADTALHLPDFRAAERTFQLLVQVAGRTGRGARGGRVLIQTFDPDHPAIQAAVRHDYHTFASGELPIREALGYPPYGAMARLVVRGPREKQAEAFAQQLAAEIQMAFTARHVTARTLGPAPAPIAKLRDNYRFHVQFQSLDADGLRAAISGATSGAKPPDDVQWIIDIDPIDML